MKSMPKQKPGRSKQDYETPDDFIEAVVRKFGPIAFDLAATSRNAKAEKYFNSRVDSFRQDWSVLEGNLWLNPPFGRIDPWAEKCKNSVQFWRHVNEEIVPPFKILLLTPASVGSNWFAEHVYGNAEVFALSPRLQFKGEKDPYPKDCMLSLFGSAASSFTVWRWK